MKTVRLIGSNILFDVKSNSTLKNFTILDSILWHSPFSIVKIDDEPCELEEDMNYGDGEGAEVLSLEFKKNFDELIGAVPTDYVVIESIGACWYNLIEFEGKVYSKNRFIEKIDWYKNHKEEFKIINLKNESDFNWKRYFDEYIKIIKKYYAPEKIIYIRSHFSGYCKFKNFLKDEMIDCKGNLFLKEIDDYFIKETQCKEINISENFFSDVDGKYGKNICFYENDYYITLIENINYAISDTGVRKIFDEINYATRLNRYIECYESITFNNLACCYWRMNKWLDKISFNLGYKALIIFKDLLLIMAENNAKCLQDIECISEHSKMDDFRNLVFIIEAIEKNTYNETLRWELAFKYEIESLKKLNCNIKEFLSNEINTENVDFTEYKNFELVKYFFEGKITKDIFSEMLVRKTKIDVWGSCVTREVFNYSRVKWGTIGKYVCRNSVLFSFDDPVDEVGLGIDFSDLSDFGNNVWRRKVIEASLRRTNIQWLKESDSEWIIVDLYDIAKKNVFKYNNRFFCVGGRWLSYNFWEKIADKVERVNIFELDESYIKKQIDKFILFVKERYGNKIILCSVNWKELYITSSGELKTILGVKKDYDKKNAFVRKWESYIKDNLDCYYVDVSKWFYADELNPYILSGVHYEMEYYDEMSRILKEIILCMPERRVYDECSVKCELKRAIRFKNMEWNKYLKCMNNNNIVIKLIFFLERDLVEKYLDVLEQIYRNNYDSINSCLKKFHFELWNAEKLKTTIKDELYNGLLIE